MTDKKTEALKLARDWIKANGRYDKAASILTVIELALAEQPVQQQDHVSVMTVLHLKDQTEIGYGPVSACYDLPTGEYKLYTSPPASKPEPTEKLVSAAGLALEVLKKHRQMKGEYPVGMLGVRAVEEIEAAFREIDEAAHGIKGDA